MKGGKSVKDERGQRRSERVKQQAEADVIVLSSDDEEAVSRIKQQAEAREREELKRLQDEEDERLENEVEEEEEVEEDREELENMVRLKKEKRVEVGRKKKKVVKRRLMSEENLVSSEDSEVDSHNASLNSDSDHGSSFQLGHGQSERESSTCSTVHIGRGGRVGRHTARLCFG